MTAALRPDHPGVEVASVEVLSRDDGTNRRARLGITYSGGAGPPVVFAKGEGPWRESHARNGNLFNEPELFAARIPSRSIIRSPTTWPSTDPPSTT
jgi:hypothetical protein